MNILRRGPPTLDAERENFEKFQTTSIHKAINTVECAAKEKHIRNTILGTHQEKGAQTFWHVVRRLPLSSESIVGWKFCHVLHKLLREGHPNVIRDSIKYRQQLKDLARNWGHTPHGYGKLIGCYLKCLLDRMEFHKKYESFPGNLSISEDDLEKIGQNDVNAFFELSVDILDGIDWLMELQQKIFSTLDMSRAVSLTGPGQCRLSPCILVILDSSQLYDYVVKLLFKLHTCLPPDTLSGHRERFKNCHTKLKKFYYICSNLQYFKKLIQVPQMHETVPDFLIAYDGSHELGPVRVLPEETDRSASPEPPPVANLIDTNFDDLFGSTDETFNFNGVQQPDPRDQEIQMLRSEIERLKAEIELMQNEHSEEVRRLLDRIHSLERELDESRVIASNTHDDLIKLRRQVCEAEQQAETAVKAQSLMLDIEKRAQGSEDMYRKLKEKHMSLVKDHADLLRKNADTKRQAETLQQSAGEVQDERSKLLAEINKLRLQLNESELTNEENKRKQKELKAKLLALAAEEAHEIIQVAVDSLDDESNSSRTCSAESLMHIATKATEALNKMEIDLNKFTQKDDISGLLRSISSFGHWMAETIENGGATCNMAPDQQGTVLSPTKWRNHLFDLVMALETACRSCGKESLTFLGIVKHETKHANGTKTKDKLTELLSTAQELLPKMADVRGGDLHDMVEQEMASTSKAIEQAAQRIEALLNEARQRDSGVNLEVNERILDSCTELMEFIRVLIMASKELQREIVSQGRGASSSKEFYMKNSRWTEGLISAAKAVGFGATMLTDAADLVIQGDGKFEELMVCSHEIAASTAQLVAASRVKANRGSERLTKLQSASRNVNGATARVVASTNAGRRQLDESSESLSDLTNAVTLTQIKRREMDSRVKVLELEQALEVERRKLGTLKKKHYELAGVKEEDENEVNQPEQQGAGDNQNNNNINSNNGKPPKPIIAWKPQILPKPELS
uniref:Huntingtin-interacting protein 1 n=1 Tax=Phallusia mammillata TaxID=59560 RepID=A0A6F9DF97_9ASCI|nr:huntingtin-interacting protein 1 [Phallusia mammillata]